ncbi:MAG: hypothetical protein ABIP39_16395, partial [Polyangiaceae bacterium]
DAAAALPSVVASFDASSDGPDAAVPDDANGPVPEALDPHCAPVLLANDQKLRAVAAANADCADAAEAARARWHECSVSDSGSAWTVAITSASAQSIPATDPGQRCTHLTIAFAVAHVSPTGEVALTSPSFAEALSSESLTDHDGGTASVDVYPPYLETSLSLARAFDADGDGEPELLVAATRDAPEFTLVSSSLWTFRNGKVSLYGEGRLPAIVMMDDVDEDGRPDIVTRGPYQGKPTSWFSSIESPWLAPMFLAHALEDGGFTESDLVARSWVKRMCRTKPKAIKLDGGPYVEDEHPVAEQIVCARVWGASEAEAIANVKSVCETTDPDAAAHAPCPDELKQVARIRPPIRLP